MAWFSLTTLLLVLGAVYCVYIVNVFYRIAFPPSGVFSPTPLPGLLAYPFKEGDELDLEVRVSTSPFANVPLKLEKTPPIWQTKILYGMSQPKLTANVTATFSPNDKRYSSKNQPFGLYLWAYVTKSGFSPNPEDRTLYNKRLTTVQPAVFRVIEFLPLKTERSLLTDDSQNITMTGEIVPHLKPRVLVRLVHEDAQYPPTAPPMFGPQRADAKTLFPTVVIDEMWATRDSFVPLGANFSAAKQSTTDEDSNVEIEFTIEYEPISAWAYRLHGMILQALDHQTKMLGGSEKDMEEVRLMFVENSPAVLLVTVVVAIFHLIFEFLSLKNDVVFWRKQKSLQGISLRSLGLQTLSKLIVLLYLRDQDANVLVVLGVALELAVSVWKLQSAVTISFGPFPTFVKFTPRTSYSKLTGEMDAYALRQLSKILCPLMLGYLVYSLVYEKHKGWYAFAISWLASCVYGFGFVLMTPQLFLNYKLKSVAHLPWRAMIYRFINTFIDDLFAFIIRMPTMHRVSVLRDDVVFFVYLYQRWIYPIDASRECDLDDAQQPPEETAQPVGNDVPSTELNKQAKKKN